MAFTIVTLPSASATNVRRKAMPHKAFEARTIPFAPRDDSRKVSRIACQRAGARMTRATTAFMMRGQNKASMKLVDSKTIFTRKVETQTKAPEAMVMSNKGHGKQKQ